VGVVGGGGVILYQRDYLGGAPEFWSDLICPPVLIFGVHAQPRGDSGRHLGKFLTVCTMRKVKVTILNDGGSSSLTVLVLAAIFESFGIVHHLQWEGMHARPCGGRHLGMFRYFAPGEM
jgi:hypothetical protein